MTLPAHSFPDVWRAHELARSESAALDTGHAALNAVLPGGGWPRASLTELLQSRPGCGEWGLLGPALSRVMAPTVDSTIVLVGAPHAPLGPALTAMNMSPSRMLLVQPTGMTERLWAAEQAMRCADVAAVLLWLDAVQPAQLRRLHLAAQAHHKWLFAFRPERAQHESSPAPLRLLLRWQDSALSRELAKAQAATPALWVRVLKRRGPPLEESLPLVTLPAPLQALLKAARTQARLRRSAAVVRPWDTSEGFLEPWHAVDRAASLA